MWKRFIGFIVFMVVGCALIYVGEYILALEGFIEIMVYGYFTIVLAFLAEALVLRCWR